MRRPALSRAFFWLGAGPTWAPVALACESDGIDNHSQSGSNSNITAKSNGKQGQGGVILKRQFGASVLAAPRFLCPGFLRCCSSRCWHSGGRHHDGCPIRTVIGDQDNLCDRIRHFYGCPLLFQVAWWFCEVFDAVLSVAAGRLMPASGGVCERGYGPQLRLLFPVSLLVDVFGELPHSTRRQATARVALES